MGRGNNPHRYAGLWAPWEHWADLVPHSDLCPHLTPSAPRPPAIEQLPPKARHSSCFIATFLFFFPPLCFLIGFLLRGGRLGFGENITQNLFSLFFLLFTRI